MKVDTGLHLAKKFELNFNCIKQIKGYPLSTSWSIEEKNDKKYLCWTFHADPCELNPRNSPKAYLQRDNNTNS
jgi:hypothetical protein